MSNSSLNPSLTSLLITHQHLDSVVAWRDGEAVTVAKFLADVTYLCARFPDNVHMLNACTDRYRFAVGLAAAMVSNKICVLPSTQTTETIRQLAIFAPDVFCLSDSPSCNVALPRLPFPALPPTQVSPAELSVPLIENDRTVCYVFTSGSTGVPVPHRKTWGALVRNAQAEAQACGLNDGRSHAVIGTVPPQHMYGFESTILMALQSGNALVSGDSFFAADVCDTIAALPRPRTLVSTPVHLRAIVAVDLQLPAVDLILSATAPLSVDLACEIERRFHAPLLEIYGSTETGQIAMRSPARSPVWQLLAGIKLTWRQDVMWASGAHIEQPTPLHDVVEMLSEDRFLLHGRSADMVNIAGKRNSLAYLNLQLTAVPGVVDGAFFMPEDDTAEGVARLTAFVVAPGMNAAQLHAALRQRVDAAFLPRPIIFVDQLPRNATGKLPRAALEELARECRSQLVESAP